MGIALSYPTPLNGKDFEQMVRDALQTYWKLPKQLSKLSYEGPGSGKQDGADLLGYEAKGNKVAIQVKLRKGPLSFKDVETDLKKFEAHPWHKKITTFYFATIKSPSSCRGLHLSAAKLALIAHFWFRLSDFITCAKATLSANEIRLITARSKSSP